MGQILIYRRTSIFWEELISGNLREICPVFGQQEGAHAKGCLRNFPGISFNVQTRGREENKRERILPIASLIILIAISQVSGDINILGVDYAWFKSGAAWLGLTVLLI